MTAAEVQRQVIEAPSQAETLQNRLLDVTTGQSGGNVQDGIGSTRAALDVQTHSCEKGPDSE